MEHIQELGRFSDKAIKGFKFSARITADYKAWRKFSEELERRRRAGVVIETSRPHQPTAAEQQLNGWLAEAPAVCPEHEEPLPCSACATLLIMAGEEETAA